MTRVLVALLMFVDSTPVAAKQATVVVPLVRGEVNVKTYGTFEKFLSSHLDKIIGLQVRIVAPTDERDQLQAGVDQGQFTAYLSGGHDVCWKPNEPRCSEIGASTGFSYMHGDYVFDGFFLVKYGGMHQGIQSYYLKEVDEATVKLSGAAIHKVELK